MPLSDKTSISLISSIFLLFFLALTPWVSAGCIKIALKKNFEGQIRPRSGLAKKFGVTVLNSPGTIDEDYRGEIKIILINHGKNDFVIKRGMRIAQLVISKVEKIEWSEKKKIKLNTNRNKSGFGSTGF